MAWKLPFTSSPTFPPRSGSERSERDRRTQPGLGVSEASGERPASPDGDEQTAHRLLARLSNEYATIALELDTTEANGPRLIIRSLRDHGRIALDPLALSLLCHADQAILDLLADIARDPAARFEFADWMQSRAPFTAPG